MAVTRFWVAGGTGNWNSTTNWSTATGGGSGASFPIAGDTANFDGSSGAGTATVNVSSACSIIDFTGFTGTFAGSSALAIGATWKFAVTAMTNNYTGTVTFGATSGTNAITSNGKVFKGPIIFNGVGGTWQLADAFSSNSNLTVTNGTFQFNNQTAQCNQLLTAAGTKTIALGSSQITLIATGACLNLSPTTLTLTTSGSKFIVNDSSASAKTVVGGAGNTYDDLQYSGGGTLTVSGGGPWRDITISSTTATSFAFITTAVTVRHIDFTGFAGTWAATQVAMTLTGGNLTLSAGMTNSNTALITFTDTSGTTRTVTSNGNSFGSNFTFNGVGGVWQLGDAFICTGTLTLTNGSFSTNAKTVHVGLISTSNSNIRTLNITNSTVTLTGTGSIFAASVSTNLTFTSTGSTVIVSDSSGTNKNVNIASLTFNDFQFAGTSSSTFTFTCTSPVFRDFTVSNSGTSVLAISGALTVRNLDFTGYSGSASIGGIINVSGNTTFGTGMTFSSTSTLVLNATSGTKTVTSNGVTWPNTVSFNGVGGIWQLQDALSSSSSVFLTNGSLDTNGKGVTCTVFSCASANTRSLTLGASLVTLTGTGNVWNFASPGLTLSAGASTVKVTNSSASSKTFAGDGMTFGNLWFTGTGSGVFIITGANTFADLKVDGGVSHTLTLTSGVNTTVSSLHISGSSPTVITTLNSTIPTALAVILQASGFYDGDYLAIVDSAAPGGATFYAGIHSVDNGNNTGWIFGSDRLNPSQDVSVSSGFVASDTVAAFASFSAGQVGAWTPTGSLNVAAVLGSLGASAALTSARSLDIAAVLGSLGASAALTPTGSLNVAAVLGSLGASAALTSARSLDIAAVLGSLGASAVWTPTGSLNIAAVLGSLGASAALTSARSLDIAAVLGLSQMTGFAFSALIDAHGLPVIIAHANVVLLADGRVALRVVPVAADSANVIPNVHSSTTVYPE